MQEKSVHIVRKHKNFVLYSPLRQFPGQPHRFRKGNIPIVIRVDEQNR
jgi:hypothetical protein